MLIACMLLCTLSLPSLIIFCRFQGTNDAVAIQFFLKNVHPGMKNAASILFGQPESFHSRANVFGELMRIVISPSVSVKYAVDQILKGREPDIALHMRMLANR